MPVLHSYLENKEGGAQARFTAGLVLARPHLEGYLAYKKLQDPRTIQQAYAKGPLVVLGEGGGSYG